LGVFHEDVVSKEKELIEKQKIAQDYQKQTKTTTKRIRGSNSLILISLRTCQQDK